MCTAPGAAKERALAEQQEQLLQARTEADRRLDAVNARLRAVADRERELEQRQQRLMQQVGGCHWWGEEGGRARGAVPCQHLPLVQQDLFKKKISISTPPFECFPPVFSPALSKQ